MTGDGVRVTIKDSQAVPLIEEVGVYMGVGPFAEKLLLPTGSKEVKANLFKFSENWRSFNKGILTKSNDFASYEFKGNSFFLIGSFDPTFGKLNVFVDDELVSTVDCYSPEMKSNQLLYHFDGVLSSNVFHTIKLQSANGKAVQIASLNIIDNQERGIFEFTQREFVAHVNQKSARITIQRTGGSKGKATIKLVTASGSASLGKNFDMVSQNVIFDDCVYTISNMTELLKDATENYVYPKIGTNPANHNYIDDELPPRTPERTKDTSYQFNTSGIMIMIIWFFAIVLILMILIYWLMTRNAHVTLVEELHKEIQKEHSEQKDKEIKEETPLLDDQNQIDVDQNPKPIWVQE